ncbi:MAG: hypothetical protein ACI4DY_11960 [Monoglobaceae bacterium]
MAHIKRINFTHVGKNEGCLCDKCGQYIQNIVYVDYDDGVRLNYGQDCFAKLYNSGRLNAYGVKLMKKTLKSIEKHSKQLDAYKSGKMNAENDVSYQYDQTYGGYWKGKPYEEYRNWMIEEWFPKRFEEDQKEIDRFAKVNFDR